MEARLRVKDTGDGDDSTNGDIPDPDDQSRGSQSTNSEFVDFFRQASPYIANHRGAVHVVVVPGSVMVHEDKAILNGIVQDVQMLNSLGVRVVLVLGSNEQVNEMSKKRGVEVDVVDGYRVTSPESLEIAMEAAGRNNVLVQALLSRGINVAVTRKHGDRGEHVEFLPFGSSNNGFQNGLNGTKDGMIGDSSSLSRNSVTTTTRPGGGATATSGNFITAKRRGIVNGVDFLYTGDVVSVDVNAIYQRLSQGDVVLLSSLGFNAAGEVLNCQCYDVAVSLAIDINADKLISYVAPEDMPVNENGTRAKYFPLSSAENYIGSKWAEDVFDMGSMGKQYGNTNLSPWRQLQDTGFEWRIDGANQEVCAAVFTCKAGVRRAHLLDYTVPGALLLELYTLDGIGAMVSADRYEGTRQALLEDWIHIKDILAPLAKEGIVVKKSDDDLIAEVESGAFSVVERDGKIIACAALRRYEVQVSEQSRKNEKNGSSKESVEIVAEVAAFAVKPAYRNEGRGDQLLTYLENVASESGITKLFLLTTRTADWFSERGFLHAGAAAGNELLPPGKEVVMGRNSQVYIRTLR